MSQMLASEISSGYDGIRNMRLITVNGERYEPFDLFSPFFNVLCRRKCRRTLCPCFEPRKPLEPFPPPQHMSILDPFLPDKCWYLRRVLNLRHLRDLVTECKDKFMVFGLSQTQTVVLDREEAMEASQQILLQHSIANSQSEVL